MNKYRMFFYQAKTTCAQLVENAVVNHLTFVDDVCAFVSNIRGLQCLFNICCCYSGQHRIVFNCKKTVGAAVFIRQRRSQTKNFGGAKMFDFGRITLFCLEKRLSKHKMTIFSKNLGGMAPLAPLATLMLPGKVQHQVCSPRCFCKWVGC